MDSEPGVALVAEQLGRLADRIEARLKAVEDASKSRQLLDDVRTANTAAIIQDIKKTCDDHEDRIREAEKTTTKNQTILGLITGGSSVASIIALIKAWLGGP